MEKELVLLLYLGFFLILINHVYAWNDNSQLIQNVSQCGKINTSGAYYTLNQSIINNTLTTSCLNVTVENVTVDCRGYNITIRNNVALVYGNKKNITVKNCIFSLVNSSSIYDGVAINLDYANNSYIFNNTITDTGMGISFNYVYNSTIEGNIMSNVPMYGIILLNSFNNTIKNNNVSYVTHSAGYAIGIQSSGSNNLSNNDLFSSTTGLDFSGSSLNIISFNRIFNNSYLGVSVGVTASNNRFSFNNLTDNYFNLKDISYSSIWSIDNLLNGKNFYYNKSISNYEYNESTSLNAGAVYCSNCINVTIKNINISGGSYDSVSLYNSSNVEVNNVTIYGKYHGIYISSSSNLSIVNSGLMYSYEGINLDSSTLNLSIINNSLIKNYYGISGSNLKNHTIKNNTFNFNYIPISSASGSSIIQVFNNHFSNNVKSPIFRNTDNTTFNIISDERNSSFIIDNFNGDDQNRFYNLNEPIYLNLSIYFLNLSICPIFTYNISIYPLENFNVTNNSNNLTLNFTPSKTGLYSVLVNITPIDGNNNSINKKYSFFVGNLSSGTYRYYFHKDEPDSPYRAYTGQDVGSLYSYAPLSEEIRACASWVEYHIDDFIKPLGIIINISAYLWYKSSGISSFGVEKYGTYSSHKDYSVSVPSFSEYTFYNINLSSLNFTSHYLLSQNNMALKLVGTNPYVKSNSTNPSYADITYLFSGPRIEQIIPGTGSNIENVELLSSVFDDADNDNITMQMKGVGNYTFILNLSFNNNSVLYDSILCPIVNCTINSDSNNLLNVTLGLSGSLHTLRILREIIPPSITINSPSFGQILISSVFLNISLDEQGSCLYSTNFGVTNGSMDTIDNKVFTKTLGLTDGGYTVNFYCNDTAGNRNESMNVSFSIISSISSSSSGGGSSTIDYVTEINFEKGYLKYLSKDWEINFKFNKKSHKLRINSINDINKTATITVSSLSQTKNLHIGEDWKINLNEDNYLDMYVKLNDVSQNKAYIYMKKINETIQKINDNAFTNISKNISNKEDLDRDINNKNSEIMRNNYYILYFILLILVLIVIIVLFVRMIKK